MHLDFYLIAKMVLLFCVWFFIVSFTVVILKSKNLYSRLKKTEVICINKRKELIYNFLPTVSDLAKKNETVKSLLNFKRSNTKEFLISVFPLLFQGWIFYQWIKSSFGLRNKVLR